MNIFAFHPDPIQSALWLDDVRKNKMVLETAQLLSTAINISSPGHNYKVYKTAYLNHPCAKWARRSRQNFHWLTQYFNAVLSQRNRPHKSRVLLPTFQEYVKTGEFFLEEQTPFANCARNLEVGVDFSHVTDVHDAYRQYICARWKRDTILLSWNHGQEPEWRYATV